MQSDSQRRLDWISLSKADTGFVFATTHSISGSRWPWISDCVAQEFECNADDLDCVEDDEGREFVAFRGEPLVEIHNCYLTGNVAGLVRTREAA